MANELWDALMKFYREIIGPRFDALDARVDGMVSKSEMMSYMDDVYVKFGRLETEYHALSVAVRRLEDRMASVDEKLDRIAMRSELFELKDQLANLTERIAQLEKALN